MATLYTPGWTLFAHRIAHSHFLSAVISSGDLGSQCTKRFIYRLCLWPWGSITLPFKRVGHFIHYRSRICLYCMVPCISATLTRIGGPQTTVHRQASRALLFSFALRRKRGMYLKYLPPDARIVACIANERARFLSNGPSRQ